MSDHTPSPPLRTLKDGRLKANIWENQSEKGLYHTVTLAKVYEDKDGQFRETQAFSANELLRVAELTREAHGIVLDMRRQLAFERQEKEKRPSVREGVERPARFRR